MLRTGPERISASGESRIVTERISAATKVTDGCGADIRPTVLLTEQFISHSVEHTVQHPGISPRSTVAILRENDIRFTTPATIEVHHFFS